MEYEIGDDPQGLPDRPNGDRDGGLREGGIFFRKRAAAKGLARDEDDVAVEQMGEAA